MMKMKKEQGYMFSEGVMEDIEEHESTASTE